MVQACSLAVMMDPVQRSRKNTDCRWSLGLPAFKYRVLASEYASQSLAAGKRKGWGPAILGDKQLSCTIVSPRACKHQLQLFSTRKRFYQKSGQGNMHHWAAHLREDCFPCL